MKRFVFIALAILLVFITPCHAENFVNVEEDGGFKASMNLDDIKAVCIVTAGNPISVTKVNYTVFCKPDEETLEKLNKLYLTTTIKNRFDKYELSLYVDRINDPTKYKRITLDITESSYFLSDPERKGKHMKIMLRGYPRSIDLKDVEHNKISIAAASIVFDYVNKHPEIVKTIEETIAKN